MKKSDVFIMFIVISLCSFAIVYNFFKAGRERQNFAKSENDGVSKVKRYKATFKHHSFSVQTAVASGPEIRPTISDRVLGNEYFSPESPENTKLAARNILSRTISVMNAQHEKERMRNKEPE